MSNIINKEKLCAGIVFGDPDNDEFIFMPGGEIGSPFPICVMQTGSIREDIGIDQAAEEIYRLNLKPLEIEPFSKI